MKVCMCIFMLDLARWRGFICYISLRLLSLSDEHLVQSTNCCSQCSVWVARKPPGFAFIDFDDRRDAEDAIRDLDGMLAVSFG
jgi:RNA recognition motif-containing protein